MPVRPETNDEETLADSPTGSDRRQFLKLAGTLIASVGALEVLAACRQVAPTSAPAPSVTPTATTSPTPTPTLIPTPVPTPTPTPAPTSGLTTERSRVGHLLRRAGFGANQQELNQFAAMGVSATVDYLVDYEKVDDSAIENRLAGLTLTLDNLVDLQRWWFLRMIYTKRPLQEKMTLFWHGLLTSGYSKVGQGPYMHTQNQLLRKLCLGRYDELLKAIARDPAMLIWLDSQVNKKAAPNENFARELMELFSMGIGPYTEGDVRESARAFTGWGLRQKVFNFTPEQHDFGSKLFLGRTGNFDGDDIINIIVEQPATAEFIARKLFTFFVYDDPTPEVVARLASTFRETQYSIKEVMRQILTSSEFYSAKAYRAGVKSPVELIAGTIRSLEIETDGIGLPAFADRMGQSLFNPFDVSGWPGGAAWINSSTILQRLNFANTVSTARSRTFQFSPQGTVQRLDLLSAKKIVTHFIDLLLDGNMSAEERNILMVFGHALNSLSDFSSSPSPTIDEKLRGVVYLILASPDYQLA
ncbi:MAG: DUF1800 domain-containing protein [Chloroflexi bacterium]|nr:DUF1800 domain-containing protein [Chloroflexota bacterium]